jgi:isopenicillin-N N-acyltransferase-like protein
MVDLTTGEFWLASGNPCETDYAPLPWSLWDGPPAER